MRVPSLRTAAIALAAGVGLGGCAYGPMGGVSVGYGNAGYYDPYYSGYSRYGSSYGYSPYGSRYGYSPYGSQYGYAPYWGWHDGYYYPGAGYYVYDRYRNPYYWSDSQRRYWSSRPKDPSVKEVWVDFARDHARRQTSQSQPSTSQVQSSGTSSVSVAAPTRVERVRTRRTETRDVSRPVRVERRARTTSSSSSDSTPSRRIVIRERRADKDD